MDLSTCQTVSAFIMPKSEGGEAVAPSVQITLIICLTVIVLFLLPKPKR